VCIQGTKLIREKSSILVYCSWLHTHFQSDFMVCTKNADNQYNLVIATTQVIKKKTKSVNYILLNELRNIEDLFSPTSTCRSSFDNSLSSTQHICYGNIHSWQIHHNWRFCHGNLLVKIKIIMAICQRNGHSCYDVIKEL